MAAGDLIWFNQALVDLGNAIHNLSSNTLRVGIVVAAAAPAKTTAAPHWGGTGTTNMSTNQVSTGGGYTGPIALTSVTWTNATGNDIILKATDVVISQNASGFTNGRYGIIYNDTDANKRCLGYIDFGADKSIVSGSLTINFQGSGTDVLKIAN